LREICPNGFLCSGIIHPIVYIDPSQGLKKETDIIFNLIGF
jgi:hypothetical protein